MRWFDIKARESARQVQRLSKLKQISIATIEDSAAFFDAYLKQEIAAKKWLDESKTLEHKS